MSVEIIQENNVIEIIEETATLVEVITEGPQGPPPSSLYKRVEPAVNFTVTDEDEVFIMAEGIIITLPDVSLRNPPVVILSELYNATIESVSPLQFNTISPGQARELTPTSTGWKQI